MTANWHFNKFRPGDRAREPQIEKFFNDQKDRASPIIREGIQNSMDAAREDDSVVRIRLTLNEWPATAAAERWAAYGDTLTPHAEAAAAGSDKFPDPPEPGKPFRFLVFEDFGTTGLDGDPTEWRIPEGKNPFFDFFRAEGVSHKEGDSRGRHGVGKYVFLGASQVRAVFGLTKRADGGQELLMGTSVLRNHRLNGTDYLPDGWYGERDPKVVDNVLPVEDPEVIVRFKADFGVSRTNEPGLSVVVPWLHEDIQQKEIIEAVVEGYFLPLVRNHLVAEVYQGDVCVERIDHQTLHDVVGRQGAEYAAKMAARLTLAAAACDPAAPIKLAPPPGTGAPNWAPECLPPPALEAIRAGLKAGEIIRLECPTRVRRKKDKEARPDSFRIYLRREEGSGAADVSYVRQGILVSGVRARVNGAVQALVVIDDGVLATFLGDAENPAHTLWQSEFVRSYSYNKATIDYVVDSVRHILTFAKDDDQKPDPTVMRDLFHEPDPEPAHPKPGPKGKDGKKDGPVPPPPPAPPPPSKPKSYTLTRTTGGFKVGRGSEGVARPVALTVLMAYDNGQKNPLRKYHPADFRLDEGDGLTVESVGLDITECAGNCVRAAVLADDIELVVSGFDENRDLYVDVRPTVIKPTAVVDAGDEEETEEVADAATV